MPVLSIGTGGLGRKDGGEITKNWLLLGGHGIEFTIGVGEVIAGWDRGVMRMSLGEKAKLHVPSAFGYGEHGAGGVISPHADLNFRVELLEVNGQEKQSVTVIV